MELRPGLAVATVSGRLSANFTNDLFVLTGNLVVRDNSYTLELLEDERGEPEAKVGDV